MSSLQVLDALGKSKNFSATALNQPFFNASASHIWQSEEYNDHWHPLGVLNMK